MSLQHDLLDQALFLATREPRRPKQASLRRAVSAAYYAIFHLLISDASSLFAKDQRILAVLNRAYSHGEMVKAAKQVSNGKLPHGFDRLGALVSISPKLQSVAKAFADLQEARHSADYDLAKEFTRSDALSHINQSQQAFADWEEVRKEDCSRLFLASFLLWEKWDRQR